LAKYRLFITPDNFSPENAMGFSEKAFRGLEWDLQEMMMEGRMGGGSEESKGDQEGK
jgi:hypothetical protein